MAILTGKYARLSDGNIIFVPEEDVTDSNTWHFLDIIGWTGIINGVTNPTKICGIAVTDIVKVCGI